MAGAAHLLVYKDLLIFLVVAGVIAPLMGRFRLSPILGFLVAGVLLGPEGLGRVATGVPQLKWVSFGETEELAPLAELGVVFLLFMIGLELSWERIRALRRLVFGLGFAQMALCTALVGLGAAALGAPPAAAAAIGAAMSLSSTALVIPSFSERKRLAGAGGRAALAVLLAQDLAVAPILVSLGLFTTLRGGAGWVSAVAPLGLAVAALMAIVVGGRLLLRPLFHSAARSRSPEMFAALSLLVVVGSAAAAAAGGLSMALGAFIAGLLLAETEFRREVEVVIDPFKGLLLGAFFVSAGAGLRFERLVAEPGPALIAIAGVVAVKVAATAGLGRLFALPARAAAEAALPLAPPGEFAFVVLAQAAVSGVLAPALEELLLVSAGVSLFLIPPLAAAGARIGAAAATPSEPQPEAIPAGGAPEAGRVLVIGYGRVGRLVGELLAAHGIDFTAIDADPQLVATERAKGVRIYFGDAARPAFLVASGVETTRAVVVTMDAPAKVDDVVRTVRALRPDLTLIARARDARHAEALYRLGVTDAVPEAIEASLQLAENTLVDLGVPMGLVIASVHEKRDALRLRLAESAGREAPVRPLRRTPRLSGSTPDQA